MTRASASLAKAKSGSIWIRWGWRLCVRSVAADAEAADAEGVEELDERVIAGSEVGEGAVGVGEESEGLEAQAEEAWEICVEEALASS